MADRGTRVAASRVTKSVFTRALTTAAGTSVSTQFEAYWAAQQLQHTSFSPITLVFPLSIQDQLTTCAASPK